MNQYYLIRRSWDGRNSVIKKVGASNFAMALAYFRSEVPHLDELGNANGANGVTYFMAEGV